MRLFATHKAHQNQRGVDPWTIVHFSSGLTFGLMDVPLRTAVVAGTLYEVAEQVFERSEGGQRFFVTSGPESPINAVVDMVVLVAGHQLGAWWNRT